MKKTKFPAAMLNNLHGIIQTFEHFLGIDETIAIRLEKLMQHMNCEAASVFLGENDSDLIFLASAGPTNLKGLVIERDTGIVGKAVKNSEILMVRNTRQSDQFFQEIDEKTGFVTRSILCAPLNVNQKTIGAIEVLNKIPSKKNPGGLFSDVDQHLLRILSSAAALAIHNAKMASELLRSEMLQQ